MDTPTVRTRTDLLAAEIADAIIRGELQPGMKLDEQTLADRFGVSRTPVREALRQLGSTGLVSLRPHRGAVVADISPATLDELFVAMAELEASCARLSALSMSPIERRRLSALHESMGGLVAAGDRDGYSEANFLFHDMIYKGAHNGTLAEMATALRRRLSPFRRAQFSAADRVRHSHAEHALIVEAVRLGDAAGAHEGMLAHVHHVESVFDTLRADLGRHPPHTG